MDKLIIGLARKRSFAPADRDADTILRRRVEQRPRLPEIGRVEAFGEPAVDRREDVAGFGAAALVAAEPREARGGSQFPELGLLLPGDAQGFAIELLGRLGMPLPQQQPTFMAVQL